MLSRTTWITAINAKKHMYTNLPDLLEYLMVLQQLQAGVLLVRVFRRCRCYTFMIVYDTFIKHGM
jgi:hypothetical protein